MQPFWLVQRLTVSSLKKEQENGATLNFNLEFKEGVSGHMGSWHDESMSLVYKVSVPVLTNTCKIQRGEELVLKKDEAAKRRRQKTGSPASRGEQLIEGSRLQGQR